MDKNRNAPLIVHQTVSAATANSLRERILRGDFSEGQPLLQDALAAEYGVSRIPLREALRQLETEGLVTSIPHRGCMVAVLSLEEIVEIWEIRAMLESDVLAHAIPNLTKDHFDRAQKVLNKCKRFFGKKANAYEFGILSWGFHSILYEASNRQRSLMLISNLHNIPDRLAHLKVIEAAGLERIHLQNCEILDHCRQGKGGKAVECLRAHILEACDILNKYIASQETEDSDPN